MSVLLMYVSLAIWLVALAISAYTTYRLYEYGSSNINAVWGMVRSTTDTVTCVALGVAGSLFVPILGSWFNTWVLMTGGFVATFFVARIILMYSVMHIAKPYRERNNSRHNYCSKFREAEESLRKEGLWPTCPHLLDSTKEEWVEYRRAIEALRTQRKLPPVPEWMKKEDDDKKPGVSTETHV
jgi:hypothetical protein